ncbi:MAG TPA: hypothetical protein VF472_12945 [Burkholderiaceae bacterium]
MQANILDELVGVIGQAARWIACITILPSSPSPQLTFYASGPTVGNALVLLKDVLTPTRA